MKTGMKEIKYLNENEIEVDGKIYTISKDQDIIPYAERNWRVLERTDKYLVLMLDGKIEKEEMLKIFNNNLLDDDGDIKFNINYDNIWWKDSPIRMGLNSKFLETLNINDLLEFETKIDFNGETQITRDYVRIPTKEEFKSLPKESRVLKNPNGTVFRWTLSPSSFYGCYASVFGVNNNGDLDYSYVHNSGGVAPVIRLKTDALKRSKN